MKGNTYIFSLFFIFLAACEESIDLELPEYENEMVIYGVLIAGEKPKILLTESTSYFDPLNTRDNIKAIYDAQVILNDGDHSYNLTNDAKPIPIYTNSVIINEGKTYTIEVKHKGRIITGETTVPKKVNLIKGIYEIELLDNTENSESICWKDKVELYIEDPLEENYYQINNKRVRWKYRDCRRLVNSIIVELDSCISSSGSQYFPVFSDNTFNGNMYKHELLSKYRVCIDSWSDTLTKSKDFVINKYTLQSVSKELYDFNTSIDRQIDSEFNPFQEPFTIKSSVEGGIGVFASKSTASDTIIIRTDYRF